MEAGDFMNCQQIEQAMSLRAKYTRRQFAARSGEQRLGQFAKLQQASFEILIASPAGYQNFLRRNLFSRRVEVVDGEYRPFSSVRRTQQA